MKSSVVAELEGTIVKDPDPFAYFMLIAFEASGPIRFAILLLFWPVIRLLDLLGLRNAGLRLTIFVTVTGLRMSDIEYVGRAVLPKFYMGDLDMGSWRVFSQYEGKRVIVTNTPRVMVERFVKNHLRADHVIGTELAVNRFGYATGLLKADIGPLPAQISKSIGDDQPIFLFGKSAYIDRTPFMSQCKMQGLRDVQCKPLIPLFIEKTLEEDNIIDPVPVIFHDGRLAKKPKPCMALIILLWFPIGVINALLRMILAITMPMFILPYELLVLGIYVKVKGNVPPPPRSDSTGGGHGVLFVCNHRTSSDGSILSHVLGRKTPVVTHGSNFNEMLSQIPCVRLSRDRDRHVDAAIIKGAVEKGDLIICPEGTTCREPFLLRFSALFTEVTNHIVPVAINHDPCLFYATTTRGYKGLDFFFLFMNPIIIYEITFLDKLEADATYSPHGQNSPYQVANLVQALLATTLGFTSTTLTRKDKHATLV